MQKILFSLICFCSILLCSCAKDKEIGALISIEDDYVLPQGNASQKANDRIQEVYDKYGSYLLYEYTQKDFLWTPSTGSASANNPNAITAIKGDPTYVEDMLNFLDNTWLQFFPDNFLKDKGLPYRVFLADTIKQFRVPGTYSPSQLPYMYFAYQIYDMSITFTGMNKDLKAMDVTAAVAKKNQIQVIIWNYYVDKGIINLGDVPKEFSDLAVYTGTIAAYSAPTAAVLQRGFLPYYTVSNSAITRPISFAINYNTWYTSASNLKKENDARGYILTIVQNTADEMKTKCFDTYPLIKQKYDILTGWFKTKYGVDLQAIGNWRP